MMYSIHCQGGARSCSLCAEVIRLWNWCVRNRITLIGSHLPGVNNTAADALSRHFAPDYEWELQDVFLHIFSFWGFLWIDLFASDKNAKCRLYCSRAGIGKDSLGDAFLHVWTGPLLYAGLDYCSGNHLPAPHCTCANYH